MKEKKQNPSRWLYGIAILPIIFGTLVCAWILKISGIGMYPAMIADAYSEDQHHLAVPGSKDIKLTRTGAYGIYYEYSLVSASVDPPPLPPEIDCYLTSKSTGVEMEAAPDYVETNRYWSKDRERTGVLIMSITVNEPDTYTFACRYQDGTREPEIVVALGPNYIWEFLSIAGSTVMSTVAGLGVLFGSGGVALIVVIVIAVKRQRSSSLALVACLTFAALFLSSCGTAKPDGGQESTALRSRGNPPPRGCTIFTVSQGDRVFFGGNGDWINFDSNYYWVDPGGAIGYGAIYFGVPSNVQQGFNEKGLAYDSNGLPQAPVNVHPGRKPVYGSYTRYPIQILRSCATVEEVIAWVQEYRWHEAMHDQMHFADATGDAVVISAGPDGKVAFTRKPPGDSFLVSTNFNLANPANGFSYPC